MAAEPYDRPGYEPNDSKKPVTKPDLQALEGGGDTTPRREGHLHAVDDKEAKLYNPDGDTSSSTDKEGEGAAQNRGIVGRVRNFRSKIGKGITGRLTKFAKSKWAIPMGIAGVGFIGILAFFFFFLASLEIPHFVEHVTAYQFTRTTRQMTQTTENLTEENMSIRALTKNAYDQAKSWFNDRTAVQKTKDLWSKLDKYRPNKIINNYNTQGTFTLVYDNNGNLRGVTTLDRTLLIQQQSGFKRFVPPLKFKGSVDFASEVAPYLKSALKADNIGPITRYLTAKEIRQRLGISLIAWKIGEYQGDTPDQAKLQQAKDLVKAINEDKAAGSQTAVLESATNDAKEQLDKDLNNDKTLLATVDNGGADPAVASTLSKLATGSGSILQDIAGFLSPVYQFGMPVCLVYDGSAIKGNENFADTVNANTDEQIRTGMYMDSAASTIINGSGAPAEGVGALSDRLGGATLSQSPPEIRAAGGTVDTSQYVSTEASAAGNFDYTAFDAIFGGGAVGSAADFIANNICPIITNTTGAITFGAVNLGLCFTPLGAEVCGDEELAAQSAKTALGRFADRWVSKFASEQTGDKVGALASYIATTPKDLIKVGGAIGGATLLTHFIVLERAGATHNGTQSNNDLAVDADAGNNLYAQQLNQQEYYGRPLTDSEIAQSVQADQTFRAQQAGTQTAYQRYLSPQNPDSLASRFAVMAMAHMNASAGNSLLHLSSMLLSPLRFVGSAFLSLNSKAAFAADAPTSANTFYGNVQFGYSEDEMKLIQTDPSYMPLENQEILDENYTTDSNGNKTYKEDQIANKYAKCFNGDEQIGDMLANGDIQRDKNGDVLVDSGLCSPDNLSYNNSADGQDISSDTKHPNDLVFRWRLAQSYNNSLDQLENSQDVTQ